MRKVIPSITTEEAKFVIADRHGAGMLMVINLRMGG
jgi:hypothetical protein